MIDIEDLSRLKNTAFNAVIMSAFLGVVFALIYPLIKRDKTRNNDSNASSMGANTYQIINEDMNTRIDTDQEVNKGNSGSISRQDDSAFYEQAWNEIEAGSYHKATWSKAYAESKGDTEGCKAIYIRIRVKNLASDRAEQEARKQEELSREEKNRTERLLQKKISGVIVLEVMPESQACEAGIKLGDVIVAVNGASIDGNMSKFNDALDSRKSGEDTVFELIRGEDELKVSLRNGPLGIMYNLWTSQYGITS